MIGTKLGKWTVKDAAPPDSSGYKRMRCVCDCGVERSVRVVSLESGHSRSCGCESKKAHNLACCMIFRNFRRKQSKEGKVNDKL